MAEVVQEESVSFGASQRANQSIKLQNLYALPTKNWYLRPPSSLNVFHLRGGHCIQDVIMLFEVFLQFYFLIVLHTNSIYRKHFVRGDLKVLPTCDLYQNGLLGPLYSLYFYVQAKSIQINPWSSFFDSLYRLIV